MRRGRRSSGVLVAAVLVVSGTLVPRIHADGVSDQQQRVNVIANQLEDLENRIGQLDEDHAAALDRIEALDTEIATAQAQVDEQSVLLTQLQGQLGEIAIDKFASGGGSGLTPLFSTAQTFGEELQRDQLSRLALNQGVDNSDQLDGLISDLADETKALQDKKDEQAALADTLAEKQEQGEALTQQYQDDYASATAELGVLVQQEQERRAQEQIAAAQQRQAKADAAAAAKASAVRPAASAPRGGGASSTPAATPSAGGGGGTSTGGTPAADTSSSNPPAQTPAVEQPSTPPPSSTAGIAVSSAYSQLGVTYRFAAESPGVAFDCSGLTKWAWGRAGVYLPHQSASQYASTPHVSQSDVQPGDLIFYKSPIGHVALYIGGGSIIHAPATGDVVKVATVNWSKVVGVSRPG